MAFGRKKKEKQDEVTPEEAIAHQQEEISKLKKQLAEEKTKEKKTEEEPEEEQEEEEKTPAKTPAKTNKKEDIWVLTEIATQTSPAIANTQTEEVLDLNAAIFVKILNDLEELKKLLD